MKKFLNNSVLFGITGLTLLSTATVTAETIPSTDYNVHFESSNIVGTGRSINMHRVPVVSNSTGNTSFYDVSFKMSMDNNGQLTFDGFSQITSSNVTTIDSFIAGIYKRGSSKYLVSGPSILSDGRKGWSITLIEPSNSSFSASWITGSATGHPSIGTHSIAANLPRDYAFGSLGNNSFPSWSSGSIVAAQQVGNTLILSRFHNDSGVNEVMPSTSLNLRRMAQ